MLLFRLVPASLAGVKNDVKRTKELLTAHVIIHSARTQISTVRDLVLLIFCRTAAIQEKYMEDDDEKQ